MPNIRTSLAYSAAESYVSLAIQVIITVVLSRLLTPKEVGTFAVAAVFTGLAVHLRNFGISDFIIQERELTAAKIRAALSLNLAISWSASAFLWFIGPVIADFYNERGLSDILRLQAIGLLFMPFGGVLLGYFKRNLNFRPVFFANSASNILSCGVAIVCAWQGLGYMSLAWSSLSNVLMNSFVLFLFKPKDFPLRPSTQGLMEVFRFGKHAASSMAFGQLGKGAPEMIIGRASGMENVAFFGRANGLIELFNKAVLQAVTPICLPYFSSQQKSSGNLKDSYLRVVSYITAVGWPFILVTGILAYSFTHLIYGDQWTASVPITQILCLVFAIELVNVFAKEALISNGGVHSSNQLQMICQTTKIAGLLLVIPYGLFGASIGLGIAAVVNFFFGFSYLKASFNLTVVELWNSCKKSVVIAILAGIPILIAKAIWSEDISNYHFWSVIAPVGSAGIWLAFLLYLKHPLVFEVVEIFTRVAPQSWRSKLRQSKLGWLSNPFVKIIIQNEHRAQILQVFSNKFPRSKIEVQGPVQARINSFLYRVTIIGDTRVEFAVKVYREENTLLNSIESALSQSTAMSKISDSMADKESVLTMPSSEFADIGTGAVIMPWLEGKSVRDRLASRSDRKSMLRDLHDIGGWLAVFHNSGPKRFECANPYERTPAFDKIQNSKGRHSAVFWEALQLARVTKLTLLDLNVTKSWLHGDCKIENFMRTDAGVIGIDPQLRFENACEYDLAQFWNNFDLLVATPSFLHVRSIRNDLETAFWAGYYSRGASISLAYYYWLRLSLLLAYWWQDDMNTTSAIERYFKGRSYKKIVSRLAGQVKRHIKVA